MSAGVKRKSLSVYCMACRFEQMVSCEVQSIYVPPTLEVNVSPLNMLSDCSLREVVKRKFFKGEQLFATDINYVFRYYPHMRI